MFSYILVVSRGYILLISICPMLKIGKLPIIASYIYLQFYLKITSRGQKYDGFFLLNCTKIPLIVLCWKSWQLTLSRFQNRICIIESQKKENKIFIIAYNYSQAADSR